MEVTVYAGITINFLKLKLSWMSVFDVSKYLARLLLGSVELEDTAVLQVHVLAVISCCC